MNNEDKILQILTAMNERLDTMQGEQKKTNERLDVIQAQTNARSDVMQSDISELKEGLSETKGQLNETNQIVKAILHNQEYTNAKLERLELTTAKADAVKSNFEALNKRLFAQEVELQGLKLAK